jgi:hypothetical protein
MHSPDQAGCRDPDDHADHGVSEPQATTLTAQRVPCKGIRTNQGHCQLNRLTLPVLYGKHGSKEAAAWRIRQRFRWSRLAEAGLG